MFTSVCHNFNVYLIIIINENSKNTVFIKKIEKKLRSSHYRLWQGFFLYDFMKNYNELKIAVCSFVNCTPGGIQTPDLIIRSDAF